MIMIYSTHGKEEGPVITRLPDLATIYTEDGMPSAQWEIQVLVTETGHEVISW